MPTPSPRVKPSISQVFHYHFDRMMAAGAGMQLLLLALLTLLPVIVTGLLLVITQIVPEGTKEPFDAVEALWKSMMFAVDAGNLGGVDGWSYRLLMIGVTISGLLLLSLLVGVLSNGIDSKLQELRKGRSFVVEEGHTLILGWSPNIFSVISELVVANDSVAKPRIVVLAEMDKVEMEDAIRAKVPKTGRTRIVCRSGSPIDLLDLEMVNPHDAKSIIVLSQPGDDPDIEVIKTILAITNNPARGQAAYHIVAEIHDPKNMEVAELVGKAEAQLILTSDLISRITVQTCRQSGMSVVYTELLDFEGNEIYMRPEPGLAGQPFGNVLSAYTNAVVIGLRHADGRVALNPDMSTVIATGDHLIVIGEDEDKIQVRAGTASVDEAAMRQPQARASQAERTLILGWNERGNVIITELSKYVTPGSEVRVVAHEGQGDPGVTALASENQSVAYETGDTTSRAVLDGLAVATYDHVIVLSYSDVMDVQRADARTLVTLLQLRRIVEAAGVDIAIVSEMMDVRNRDLAAVTHVDDFIVSEKLVSLMLAQVSENKDLKAVFADLLDPEGSELYLKPMGDYVALGTAVNFHTVTEAARRRGEVALGYRRQSEAANTQLAFGVVVNPNRDKAVTYQEEDRVIVIAEDG